MLVSKKVDDVLAVPQRCLILHNIKAPAFDVYDPHKGCTLTLRLHDVWFEYMFVSSLQSWELSAIKLYGEDTKTSTPSWLTVPSSRCPGWLVALALESSPGYDNT